MRTEQIEFDDYLGQNQAYDAFLDKFKPKLTTDDCYTPPMVYDAVAEWTVETYGVDRGRFVRPFYPGGDYEHFHYNKGDIVVDNPPFSIINQIIDNYCKWGIKFLMFCPGLTGLCKGVEDRPATILAVGARITYENGASVNTSFVTNLETEYIVRSCPDLCKKVEMANKTNRTKNRVQVPKYKYPPHVVTVAQVNYFSKYGTEYGVRRGEAVRINVMDEQKEYGKACFGGGLLVSNEAAAEKAAAEKAAAEKNDAIEWKLSEREKKIVEELGAQ